MYLIHHYGTLYHFHIEYGTKAILVTPIFVDFEIKQTTVCFREYISKFSLDLYFLYCEAHCP